jgi:hypothetical protein
MLFSTVTSMTMIMLSSPLALFLLPNQIFVCKLNKSLYGLKQAPRTWFLRFTSLLSKLGFRGSKSDTSLFVLHRGSSIAYLLLYVDDIILTTISSMRLQHIIHQLRSEFAMIDLGPLKHFLDISMHRNADGLFLS